MYPNPLHLSIDRLALKVLGLRGYFLIGGRTMNFCKRPVSGRNIPVAVNHCIPGSQQETASIPVAGFSALLVFCLLITSAIPIHAAYAFSCLVPPPTFDAEYKQSSFVFMGIPERGGGGSVPFRLTHVYKVPQGGLPKGAQVLVSDMGDFNRGKEYLIFGFSTKVNGSVVTTIASPCATRFSADTLVADLRNKRKKPSLFTIENTPIIFIGQVKKTQEWNGTSGERPNPLAIVDFKIVELIRNVPEAGGTYQKLKESQHLKVITCGEAYHPGDRYVVTARRNAPAELPGAPKLDGIHHTSECPEGGPIDLNEKEVIDQFSKKH